jgi:hypothetical protein
MKSIISIGFVFIIVLSIASCSDQNNQTGQLTVTIPNGERSLDFAYAQATSNYFEIIAYNSDGAFYEHVTSIGESISMTVPIGVYNVIALAGFYNSGLGYTYLLGSGFVDEILVTADAPTNTTVVLTNITLNITPPVSSDQTCGQPFSFYASGDFGCSVLSVGGPYGFVRSMSNQTGGITLVPDATKTGSRWGATYTVPGAITAGTECFVVNESYISLNDSTYTNRNTSLYNITGTYWRIPTLTYSNGVYSFNWNGSTPDSSFINQFTFSVIWAVASNSTGIGLEWGTANPN